MLKSIKDNIKKRGRGRPATGKGELIGVRFQPDALKVIDSWIAKEKDRPSRPEAIRHLVALGLGAIEPPRQRTSKSRSRALDLAGKQIDRLSDPSATDEERQQRKRRLVKGPKEFQDMRAAVRLRSKS